MRRLPLLALLVLASVLAVAAPAHAGGFATAGLSSTPEGVAPGKPWKVDITVLQHGRTPLSDLTPHVQIQSGNQTKEFTATPTGKPGVYRAEVVFPKAGRWEYVVYDGFINDRPHTFPAVEIEGTAAPASAVRPPKGGIDAGWLWGTGAALLGAAGLLALDRRRRRPDTVPGAPEPA